MRTDVIMLLFRLSKFNSTSFCIFPSRLKRMGVWGKSWIHLVWANFLPLSAFGPFLHFISTYVTTPENLFSHNRGVRLQRGPSNSTHADIQKDQLDRLEVKSCSCWGWCCLLVCAGWGRPTVFQQHPLKLLVVYTHTKGRLEEFYTPPNKTM